MRILIAEDDITSRVLLKRMLAKFYKIGTKEGTPMKICVSC